MSSQQYHERIAAYQLPPPYKTRPNFMMSDPIFCMLSYYWMIFSGVMITVYCINGWSEMMSVDLQYRNAHWLIIKILRTTFVQESQNFHLRDTKNTHTFMSAIVQKEENQDNVTCV